MEPNWGKNTLWGVKWRCAGDGHWFPKPRGAASPTWNGSSSVSLASHPFPGQLGLARVGGRKTGQMIQLWSHRGEKVLKTGGNPQVRLFNLGLTPFPNPCRHDAWLPRSPPTFRIKLALIPRTSELVKLFQTADIFLALTRLLHLAAKPG